MELDFAHNTQRWLGLQERELYPWFRRLSDEIHTAVDVGANDGMYTLYFLTKTQAQKVLAFEPSDESLRQLKTNLTLNGLSANSRLEIVPKSVSASNDADFATLDSFSERLRPPCLVKVDIDGGEVDLLKGARSLLYSPGIRWIIEVHSRALQDQSCEILQAANYRVIVVRNAWWRHFLPELRPGELNHWLVAVPQEASQRPESIGGQ
jgi:hypothetical protein